MPPEFGAIHGGFKDPRMSPEKRRKLDDARRAQIRDILITLSSLQTYNVAARLSSREIRETTWRATIALEVDGAPAPIELVSLTWWHPNSDPSQEAPKSGMYIATTAADRSVEELGLPIDTFAEPDELLPHLTEFFSRGS